MKMDCRNCALCLFKRGAYTGLLLTECSKDAEFDKFSAEELKKLSSANECPFMVPGKPVMTNEITYND